MKRRRIWWVGAIALGVFAFASLLVGVWPVARVAFLNTLIAVEARVRPLRLGATQRAIDGWIPPRSVLLAGDSLIAMLPARWVDARAVNLGRGGTGLRDVGPQLEGRASLATARALVVLVGTNDVMHRSGDEAPSPAALLSRLPPELRVIICTIPPIDPSVHRERKLADIARLNHRWLEAAAARPRTTIVAFATAVADERGALRRDLHQGDGLHLNAEGNRRLAALIREALATLPP